MTRFLIILLLPVLVLGLFGCRRNVPPVNKPIPTLTVPTGEPDSLFAEDAPLIGKAETLEEAEELAQLYGITLVEFRQGAALFHTEEDPRAVIRRGQENGWPELSLNYVKTPF